MQTCQKRKSRHDLYRDYRITDRVRLLIYENGEAVTLCDESDPAALLQLEAIINTMAIFAGAEFTRAKITDADDDFVEFEQPSFN